MTRAKVAVTIDELALQEVDRWVAAGEFPNRSQAIQEALRCLQQERSRHQHLLAQLSKLDPGEERALANEMFGADPYVRLSAAI